MTATRKAVQAFRRLRTQVTPRHGIYLTRCISPSPVAGLFIVLYLYTFFKAPAPHAWIILALIFILCLLALRAPRWAVYAVVVACMVALIGWYVFVDAQGGHDRESDRDDAVEAATSAFLHGDNPWSHRSILELPITTGPSSILLSLPFVALTGKIDLLTFITWLAFLGCLTYADIRQRNNTLLTVCLLLLFPWFGFSHALHWGLDELYYAAILSPILWLTLLRNKLVLAGVIGGFMALSRLSYCPAVLAAGLWWLLKERRTFAAALRIGLGVAGYVICVLALVWLIGGHEFLEQNFWINSQVRPLRHHASPLTSSIGAVLEVLPRGTPGSMIAVVFLMTLASLPMRRLDHPFFHMAVALLLAHTITFSPRFPMDYQLIFLIPALYGVAFSGSSPQSPDHAVLDDPEIARPKA